MNTLHFLLHQYFAKVTSPHHWCKCCENDEEIEMNDTEAVMGWGSVAGRSN